MSRKFILIDQSISSLSGHHYEYAYHVLKAAQEAGFTPYLATNLRFQDKVPVPWQIVPAYKYGFWASQSSSQWEKELDAARRSWGRRWFRMKCRFRYSLPGLMWSVRNQVGDFLIRQPIDRHRLLPIAGFVPLLVLFKILKFLVLLGLLPFVAAFFLVRAAWRWIWHRRAVREATSVLFSDLRGLGAFVHYIWSRRAGVLQWIREFRSLRRFSKDTAALFSRIPLAEDDIVFIPTISTVEMMGLKLFFQTHPSLPRASWHLLYRRDIYRGREVDYARQDGWIMAMGAAFRSFLAGVGKQRVSFYTDTDELTAQYNRLGAAEFHTVPIPHTHRPAPEKPAGPLRLIYVGDARKEKGFHLIPHVLQELWQDYAATGRIACTLQANYNIPQGEPEAVIAKGSLLGMSRDVVQLLDKPLSSEQYAALLLSGDINLLLYDRDNYYARSSGILVESLAAGMPVVAPAGSWLVRQFLAEQYAWQESLRERMTVVQTLSSEHLRWQRKQRKGPVAGGSEVSAPPDEKILTLVRVPVGATIALITFTLPGSIKEALLTVDPQDAAGQALSADQDESLIIEANRQDKAVHVAILAHGAGRLSIGLRSPTRSSAVPVANFRIDFLSGAQPPLSAVGVSYHRTRDIAPCMRELIDNYAHYRSTAVEFSAKWFAYHNAAGLVEVLAGKTSTAKPHAASLLAGAVV